MNTKSIVAVFLAVLGGVAVGWFGRSKMQPETTSTSEGSSLTASRRVAFYQSSMHPWIKSEKPGRCTICGMELVPVYEGETGVASDSNLITLSSNSISVVGVRTSPVLRGGLLRSLRFAGVIDDDDSRHRILSAYVDGRLDELHVNFTGAEVAAGQPLAKFYSPMLLTAVREYLALSATGGDALAGQAAAQRLRQFGLMESQIQALPKAFGSTNIHVEILAPIAGTVVKRQVYAGQFVKEGEPLFEIADFNTMWFKFDAYERDLSWIQPGMPLEIRTPSVPGRVFSSQIHFIDPNLDPGSRSAKVRVELPNPVINLGASHRRQFLHRTYAEAQVAVTIPDVLLISRQAVLNPDGHPVVFVDRGAGAYERRTIVVGRAGDVAWEVLGGVSEGDLVVSHGNLLMDSQAQLARAASGDLGMETVVSQPPSAATATADLAPIGRFLVAVDSLRLALASDDLQGFVTKRIQLTQAIPTFTSDADRAPWGNVLSQLEDFIALPQPTDLLVARQQFFGLSAVILEAVAQARKQDSALARIRIFECPMTDGAFPGAPKKAKWFQWSGPLRNPWFGERMATCGAEVKL